MKQNSEHQPVFQTVFATRRNVPTSCGEAKAEVTGSEARKTSRSKRVTLHLPQRPMAASIRS